MTHDVPGPDVTPRVSVLIPVFNGAATLGETLASVQAQTISDFEVIIIDDGSNDDTAAVAARFAAADSRFRLVQRDNGGVAAARNSGLELARAPLIAPLDADDLWHPEKLERQLRCLDAAEPGTVLVYSWSVDIDEASQVIGRRLDLDQFEGDVYAALVLTNFIGNASVPLVRRESLLAIGGWDPTLRARGAQGCEDWQTYLRLAELGPFALAGGFLVGYRQSGTSMSRRVDEMTRSYELVLSEALERHAELPRSLFRWSRAAYDLYRFETLLESQALFASLLPLTTGVLGDPSWLARRSTRKKLKRWLRSRFDPNTPKRADLAEPAQAFATASPDPTYQVSEGRWFDERRSFVASLRITRRA